AEELETQFPAARLVYREYRSAFEPRPFLVQGQRLTVRAEELEKASPLELRALDDAELCDHDSPRKNRRNKQREQDEPPRKRGMLECKEQAAARGQKRGRKKRGR